jgi:propanol-preferring alcohol dehydrogenase
MRAQLLRSNQPIETSPLVLTDVPTPTPDRGQVRVRIRYCGVCRTDLHVVEGDLPPKRSPIIPGHQAVGLVDALGPDCRRLKLGQRVGIPWLGHTCGRCEYCRSERENLCVAPLFTGYDLMGGYAEYATVAEDFAYLLPEMIDDLPASPLLCAGIIGYRALKRSNLPKGGVLGIFGFGSSAHIVIQIALKRGSRVYVVSRAQEHQKLALELGSSGAWSTPEEIPEPLDSAILFAPAGTLVPPALSRLKRGGTLSVAGIYLSPIPPLDYQSQLFYEHDLRSVTANTRRDGIELFETAEAIGLRPQTTIYPFEKANQALFDLKNDRINGTAVLKIAS